MDAAPIVEQNIGSYVLSSDPARVDIDAVHRWLSEESYWAAGRDRDLVAASWANTLLVGGAYRGGEMVAAARMVTDLATFGWLCDVFVDRDHRGNGLGVAVAGLLIEHPSVAGIKRQLLATNDAHEVYRRYGYSELVGAEKWMVRGAQL